MKRLRANTSPRCRVAPAIGTAPSCCRARSSSRKAAPTITPQRRVGYLEPAQRTLAAAAFIQPDLRDLDRARSIADRGFSACEVKHRGLCMVDT
jgi:hypothetical protein